MRANEKILLMCLLPFCLGIREELQADFESVFNMPKSVSLGGGGSADPSSLEAGLINPAVFAFKEEHEFYTAYSKNYLGLTDGSDISSGDAALFYNIKKWEYRFALHWRYFAVENQYRENTYSVNLGKKLMPGWSFGLRVKILGEEYVADSDIMDDPVFNYGKTLSKSFYDLDAGMFFRMTENWNLGLSGSNLLRANTAFEKNAENFLPQGYRAGVSYISGLYNFYQDMLYEETGVARSMSGVERISESGVFVLRAGFNFSTRDAFNASAGFGLNFRGLALDYGFLYPLSGISGTTGSHFIALRFSAAKPARLKVIEQKLREKDDMLEMLESETKASQEQLYDTRRKVVELQATEILLNSKIFDLDSQLKEYRQREENRRFLELRKQEDALRKPPQFYDVEEWDTLKSIADKFYRDESKWRDIYEQNRELLPTGQLKQGMRLRLP